MKKFAIDRLKSLKINPLILKAYDEPHRFYHAWEHINNMLVKAHKEFDVLSDQLFLAIIFHDVVYQVGALDNEEKSVAMFKIFTEHLSDKNKSLVAEAILDTKTHKPSTVLGGILCKLDLDGLYDFPTFIKNERLIMKEFQKYDYVSYLRGRIKFLELYGCSDHYAEYLLNRKVNIGVYAGSFNPFHKGHLNILQKAEKIFDKVIIARGINLNKTRPETIIPMPNHQLDVYEGLLTDYIGGLGYDVTLVRGLRNASDLEYEKTVAKYLKDLKPDIKIVNLFCDAEYEHLSSSAIRELQSYNKGQNYLV